jgi:DNA-binding NtrC family response regulator
VAPGSETILLCEDEPKIRTLVETMLARQGYRVIVANTPEDALSIATEGVDPIHLLLTDVVMPRMSGFELGQAVQAERPGIKVLYMSGYTDNHITGGMELPDNLPFLQKPFTAAGLSDMVRQVIESGGGVTSHGGPP